MSFLRVDINTNRSISNLILPGGEGSDISVSTCFSSAKCGYLRVFAAFSGICNTYST